MTKRLRDYEVAGPAAHRGRSHFDPSIESRVLNALQPIVNYLRSSLDSGEVEFFTGEKYHFVYFDHDAASVTCKSYFKANIHPSIIVWTTEVPDNHVIKTLDQWIRALLVEWDVDNSVDVDEYGETGMKWRLRV